MPFPKNKVRFCVGGGTSPREQRSPDPATGVVSVKVVPCNVELPAAELFEVSKMVAAGVTLNPVNTTIIGGTPAEFEKSFEVAAEKSKSKSNTKPSNSSEDK